MNNKDQEWIAAKLAKRVNITKPLPDNEDVLTLHAHVELSRWCRTPVTIRKLRQRIHQEIVAGGSGTARQMGMAAAVVVGRIVNQEEI